MDFCAMPIKKSAFPVKKPLLEKPRPDKYDYHLEKPVQPVCGLPRTRK